MVGETRRSIIGLWVSFRSTDLIQVCVCVCADAEHSEGVGVARGVGWSHEVREPPGPGGEGLSVA